MQVQPKQIEPLPSGASASRAAAIAALGRNDDHGAAQAVAALAREVPHHAETLRLQALLACRRGDYHAAITQLRAAVRVHPEHSALLINLAEALTAIGAFAPAAVVRTRVTELFPTDPAAWLERGRARQNNSEMDAACAAYRRSVALDPTQVSARVLLAHALLACGHAEQSEQQFREVIQRAPDHAQAWFGLVCVLGVRVDDDELERLRALHAAALADSDERIFAGFAVARALEVAHSPAAAFSVLATANADRRRQLSWDAAKFSAHVDAIANTFSAPLAEADDAQLGAGAIFIVGMPRSGSTLVEQILSAHADVIGGGERIDLAAVVADESRRRGSGVATWATQASAAEWARLGRDYQRRAEAWRGSAHFTDKALLNWRLVGAAAAMLPAARFIVCRRDALATCLSCFRHLFGQEHAYTYDLVELAAFFSDQQRLTSLWLDRWPARTQVLELERLLAEPEPTIRALLDFCALPFDPACLRFEDNQRAVRTASVTQVRRPLQRGPSQTDAYGALLDPLRELLTTTMAGAAVRLHPSK